MINEAKTYPIGIPGTKWGESEKAKWCAEQSVKRSYSEEVLSKLESLNDNFDIEQYGALPYSNCQYPLYAVKSHQWDQKKATVLITGGVHGYETSGVQGAIRFLETRAQNYLALFNLVVAPCISPWGYETINRWNPFAVDPNRSFHPDSASREAAALMEYLGSYANEFLAHFDLHETTDTDNTQFRPALAARDGIEQDNWYIPDGFYLVGEADKPEADFQTAIINSVDQVTHIAPPDSDGKIIGEKLEQRGVINYRAREVGLCMGVTDAKYVTTTEVYPDSPKVDDQNCIEAQVAAVTGGLDYITKQISNPKRIPGQ